MYDMLLFGWVNIFSWTTILEKNKWVKNTCTWYWNGFLVQTVFELQNGLLLNAARKSSDGSELTPQEMTKKSFFFKVNPKKMCSTTPVFCCVHSTPAINSDQQMVSKWHWFCKKTLHEGIWLKQANRQGKKTTEHSIHTRRVLCRGKGRTEGRGHMGYNTSDRTNGNCLFEWKTEKRVGGCWESIVYCPFHR